MSKRFLYLAFQNKPKSVGPLRINLIIQNMALREISQAEFTRYNFNQLPNFVAAEKYWYADNSSNIIGTVLLDNFDKDWSYVILAKDEDGEYRAADIKISFETADDAIGSLSTKMRDIGSSRKIETTLYKSTIIMPSTSILVNNIDDEIKKYLKKNPTKLYDLSPRKFEELIASIMIDLGFDVELTKATRDGGRDLIASIKNSVTTFLAFVECKRYAPDNKVGIGIIRSVNGVRDVDRPSKSIIVTTSSFTKDAKEFATKFENQIDLKDYHNIVEWLQKYN